MLRRDSDAHMLHVMNWAVHASLVKSVVDTLIFRVHCCLFNQSMDQKPKTQIQLNQFIFQGHPNHFTMINICNLEIYLPRYLTPYHCYQGLVAIPV